MRIISGKFKGKKINQPNDKFTRPLKDYQSESPRCLRRTVVVFQCIACLWSG